MYKKINFLLLSLSLSCSSCFKTEENLYEASLSPDDPIPATAVAIESFKQPNEPKKYHCRPNKHAKVYEGQKLYVTNVADGDTISGCLLPEGKHEVKIRIVGIDCPETSRNKKCIRDDKRKKMSCDEQIPLGKKARRVARDMLYKQVVSLESPEGRSRFSRDTYGRLLSYIRTANDLDFGKYTIEQALCEEYGYRFWHPRRNAYRDAVPANSPF